MGLHFGEIMKSAAGKSLVIKINLTFLAVFLIVYMALLTQPPPALYDKINAGSTLVKKAKNATIKPLPNILTRLLIPGAAPLRIGLINPDPSLNYSSLGEPIPLPFPKVPPTLEWKHLFPEWIDEEEENEGTSCPEVPMPDLSHVSDPFDIVIVSARCRQGEVEGWNRDVERLQMHLAAGKVVGEKGRRDWRGKVKVAVESGCRPMMEVFECGDVVGREGKWWLFEVDGEEMKGKMELPVGSCMLSLPLWEKGTNEPFDLTKFTTEPSLTDPKTEAYATVLHSSDLYVCGAIVLAQSILKTNTLRDLVLLHDASIPEPKLAALSAAGWKLKLITRIRNPRAEKWSYNEYNYSKLRLWQLTEYRKVVFIDADIVVLRNLDVLFRFPQITAVGNDGVIFNSGIMVLTPSNCTFKTLMKRRFDVISYNGGDQGFINEIFVWWHRLPRRINFLKNFWSNDTTERTVKNSLFGADPPQLYAIHYLGLKPWVCHKEYDCNWNIVEKHVYASDAAHERWWRVWEGMEEGLRGFCGLTEERREKLEMERRSAEEMGVGDGRWKIKTGLTKF